MFVRIVVDYKVLSENFREEIKDFSLFTYIDKLQM